jgi:hypothetical protein
MFEVDWLKLQFQESTATWSHFRDSGLLADCVSADTKKSENLRIFLPLLPKSDHLMFEPISPK